MTQNLFRLALAAAFLAAPCAPLRALDWPNFQGPQRNGTSLETGLNLTNWRASGPRELWEATFNEGYGGAAVQGDEVFVVDRDGAESDRLICLSLEDGKEKWQFSYEYPGSLPYPGSRGVPLVEEDAVYFIGGFGQVFRVNRETHEADWVLSIQEEYGAEPPRWGWAQSPVIVGDVLVVPAMAEDVGLIGLDKRSGEELWRTEGFGDSHSNPAVLELQGVEQVVFVAQRQPDDQQIGTTISVLPETGEVLWQTDLYFNRIPIPFPTKVTEELVFLTGGYGDGSCMVRVQKSESGPWSVELVWEVEHGTQIHPPFVIDGHIYLLANENANHQGEARRTGGLMCMDLDGNIVWQTGEDPFMGRGNMILAEGHLLIQDGEVGYLRVVKPSPEGYEELAFADVFGKKKEVDEQIARQEGREVARLPDFRYWSPMALSQGRLLMRGQETLKCLDLR
jgi:outer membrane protein assembly factor BamB